MALVAWFNACITVFVVCVVVDARTLLRAHDRDRLLQLVVDDIDHFSNLQQVHAAAEVIVAIAPENNGTLAAVCGQAQRMDVESSLVEMGYAVEIASRFDCKVSTPDDLSDLIAYGQTGTAAEAFAAIQMASLTEAATDYGLILQHAQNLFLTQDSSITTQDKLIAIRAIAKSARTISKSLASDKNLIEEISKFIQQTVQELSDGLFYQQSSKNSRLVHTLSMTLKIIDTLMELFAVKELLPVSLPKSIVHKPNKLLDNHVDTQSASVALLVLQGLCRLSTNDVYIPMHLRLMSPTTNSRSPVVKIEASDPLGNCLSDISSISLTLGNETFDPVPSTADSPCEFSAKIDHITPGIHELVISERQNFTGRGLVGFTDKNFPFKVFGSARVDYSVSFISKFKSKNRSYQDVLNGWISSNASKSESSKEEMPLKLTKGNALQFNVTIVDDETNTPYDVHQCFIRLEHEESGRDIHFVAHQKIIQTVDEAEAEVIDGQYSVLLQSNAALDNSFDCTSGLYSAEMIVGDVLLAKAIIVDLPMVYVECACQAKIETDTTGQSTTSNNGDFDVKEIIRAVTIGCIGLYYFSSWQTWQSKKLWITVGFICLGYAVGIYKSTRVALF